MIRMGYLPGYPDSTTDLNTTSISALAPPPTLLPATSTYQSFFETQVNAVNDFSGALLVGTQDAFQNLNRFGIVKSVSYSGITQRLTWSVSFSLTTIGFGVDSVDGFDSTTYVAHVSAVYRNRFGNTTSTTCNFEFKVCHDGGVCPF